MIQNCLHRIVPLVLLLRLQHPIHALKPSHFNNGPITPPPPPPGTSNNNFDPYSPSSTTQSNIPMDNESVEERLASWRKQQQLKYENQSPLEAANPRDDDGRMKLLASVSKGSISLYFFILMWRSGVLLLPFFFLQIIIHKNL